MTLLTVLIWKWNESMPLYVWLAMAFDTFIGAVEVGRYFNFI